MLASIHAVLGEERPVPEVYTVIPPQPVEKKPGQLEQWQLEQYFDKGFVVLPNFFSREELQPAIEVRGQFGVWIEYIGTPGDVLVNAIKFSKIIHVHCMSVERFHILYFAA